MLIACISLEIFVGMIIIYIGNLHYYQATERTGWCHDILNCLTCCCRACSRYKRIKRNGSYLSVRPSGGSLQRQTQAAAAHDDDEGNGCCDWPLEPRMETIVDLERADSNIEVARVKVADADVKIVRSSNYVKVVEEALKKTPGNDDLGEELHKAKEEMQSAQREKEEAEAEQKLAEAQQHHAFFVKEQFEDRQERITFRKVSFWQHMATYLLYFVMLMNVFITTFGISGGKNGTVIQPNMTHGTWWIRQSGGGCPQGTLCRSHVNTAWKQRCLLGWNYRRVQFLTFSLPQFSPALLIHIAKSHTHHLILWISTATHGPNNTSCFIISLLPRECLRK